MPRVSFYEVDATTPRLPIPKAALPDPEQDAHSAVVDWKAKRAPAGLRSLGVDCIPSLVSHILRANLTDFL